MLQHRLERNILQLVQQVSVYPWLRLNKLWLSLQGRKLHPDTAYNLLCSLTSWPFTAARKPVKAELKDLCKASLRKFLTPHNLHWGMELSKTGHIWQHTGYLQVYPS